MPLAARHAKIAASILSPEARALLRAVLVSSNEVLPVRVCVEMHELGFITRKGGRDADNREFWKLTANGKKVAEYCK